jgi:uncharacterized repeat protein (TIGR01451 family)
MSCKNPIVLLYLALFAGVQACVEDQKPTCNADPQTPAVISDLIAKEDQGDACELDAQNSDVKKAVAAVKQIALEQILADDSLLASVPPESRQGLASYAKLRATVDGAPYFCFAPDTPPEIVKAYHQVEQRVAGAISDAGLKAFRISNRWQDTATDGPGQTAQGLPVTLRWSIVPDGTPISGFAPGESTDPSSLLARLAVIYGSVPGPPSAQPWFFVFQETFDNIQANSGLRFLYEPIDTGSPLSYGSAQGVIGVRGDIRIGGHSIDGNSNILAYSYKPGKGAIVLDTNDTTYNQTSNTSIRLRNILEHEIGHALGLDHVCPRSQTKLMEPFVSAAFRGSQFDDILSLQRNYGDSLEAHNVSRNNDTPVNAAPLGVITDTLFSKQWLSIDGTSDTDLFLLPATTNQLLTVNVIPADPIGGTGTYLEGPMIPTASSCTGSPVTPFNPTNQNDLILDLLGTNGTTVIASAPVQPAGIAEQIASFRFLSSGNFYIRVRGGTTNAAQLYRLEIFLGNGPQISVASTRLDAESNSGKNQTPDPSETIRYAVTLTNKGSLPASNLRATIVGPSGARLFTSVANYGNLAIGTAAEGLFTFSIPSGLMAGNTANFRLNILDDNGYSSIIPLPVIVGTAAGSMIDEDFDSQASLPVTWGQSVKGAGVVGWAISKVVSSSVSNSAFAPSVSAVGDAFLVTPTFVVPPGGGAIQFKHQYLMDTSRDGGVLEFSLNGGDWLDLLNTVEPGAITLGDYSGKITSSTSAIIGRRAWTGTTSNQFILSRIRIPSEWEAGSIAFRWRISHDQGGAGTGTGWYIDDVNYTFDALTDPFRPFISLTTSGSSLSELTPNGQVNLTISTPLPLSVAVPVTLVSTGTANLTDISNLSPPRITLAVATTSSSLSISAVVDGLVEYSETLKLAVSAIAVNYTPKVPSAISIKIIDADATVSPFAVWIVGYTSAGNPLASATADLDGDGWTNAAEFALGSLPNDPSSRPQLKTTLTSTSLRLAYPLAPPLGAQLSGETSTDLITWTTTDVTTVPNGFEVPRDLAKRFLRIVYEVD